MLATKEQSMDGPGLFSACSPSAGTGPGLLIERDVSHRVMAAVTCPEFQLVDGSGSGDQCVGQFQVVAFRKLSHVVSRLPPNLGVNRDARHRREQIVKNPLLMRQDAAPQFRNGYWRTEYQNVTLTDFLPSGQDRPVTAAGDFNQDIGVNQNDLQIPNLLRRRPPLRSWRT